MKPTRSKITSNSLEASVRRVRTRSRVLGPVASISKLDSTSFRKRQHRQLTLRQALQPLPVRYANHISFYGMLCEFWLLAFLGVFLGPLNPCVPTDRPAVQLARCERTATCLARQILMHACLQAVTNNFRELSTPAVTHRPECQRRFLSKGMQLLHRIPVIRLGILSSVHEV
jgi:hypothetical protein